MSIYETSQYRTYVCATWCTGSSPAGELKAAWLALLGHQEIGEVINSTNLSFLQSQDTTKKLVTFRTKIPYLIVTQGGLVRLILRLEGLKGSEGVLTCRGFDPLKSSPTPLILGSNEQIPRGLGMHVVFVLSNLLQLQTKITQKTILGLAQASLIVFGFVCFSVEA